MGSLQKKRIYELDGLRGIAAIVVVLYHYTTRFSVKFESDTLAHITAFQYGHYGVQMFFVISGFVIFMSINRVNSPFEFAYRRFVRLYPVFWVCMIITALFLNFLGPELLKVDIKEFIVNFTMIPSLLGVTAVDGVYWTLQVELFFYTFIFILITLKLSNKVVLISFLYILLGFILYYQFKLFAYYHYGLLFFAGINFYKMWKVGPERYMHIQHLAMLILSFLYSGIELCSVVLIIFALFYLLVFNRLHFLSQPVFLLLGKISYVLYLLHQNIGHAIQLKLIDIGISNAFILIGTPLVLMLSLSSFITFFYEIKVVRKLNAIYKTKSVQVNV